jgi:hypothetical protein
MDNPNEQNDAKATKRAPRLKKTLAFSIKPLAVLICAVYVAAGFFGLFRPSDRWHGFFESRAPAQPARVLCKFEYDGRMHENGGGSDLNHLLVVESRLRRDELSAMYAAMLDECDSLFGGESSRVHVYTPGEFRDAIVPLGGEEYKIRDGIDRVLQESGDPNTLWVVWLIKPEAAGAPPP